MITGTKFKHSDDVDFTEWESESSSRHLMRQEDGPSLPSG